MRSRVLSRAELVEQALIFGAFAVLVAIGTWVAGVIGVQIGWRLAAGGCAATVLVAVAALARKREQPTLKWLAAVVVICGLILLANALAEVRLW